MASNCKAKGIGKVREQTTVILTTMIDNPIDLSLRLLGVSTPIKKRRADALTSTSALTTRFTGNPFQIRNLPSLEQEHQYMPAVG